MARVHIVFYLFFNHLIHIIMNTKFYSLTKRGEQIVFCVTLTLFMSAFSYRASGQWYSITKDNLFRQYYYGVGNHNFHVKTRINSPIDIPANPPIMNTSASICGVIDGLINLNTSTTVANNSLYIRPTSPNNYADYINGVTSADKLAIQNHILAITPFTDGYQVLAADVNNSNSVTASDVNEMQKLLLGLSSGFARNSWEWFPSTTTLPGIGFLTAPWNYTLKATYPNVGGFGEWYVTNKTRPWIQANTPYFKTVKIGDVKSPTGSGSDHNSWVCAALPYFNSGQTEARNTNDVFTSWVKKGDIVETVLYLGGGNDIAALEIPIFIDNNKFDIVSIETLNGFKPDYHYNVENNRLTVLYLYDGLTTLNISDEDILSIKLRVKESMNKLSDYFKWDQSRDIQLLNKDIEYTDAFVELRIENIVPSVFSMKSIATHENTYIKVESDKDLSNSTISLCNMQGQILHQKQVDVKSGYSEYTFPLLPQNGMYIATLKNGNKVVSEKFIVLNN